MSSMLEQAIIDAAALRETAMKSAQAALIEKYNKEFQDTLEKLQEQEEITPPDAPAEMSQDAAAANAQDPTGPVVTDPPQDPNFGALPVTPKNDVFKKVKTAFFDLDGDDDELITINFDGLTAKPGVDTSFSAEGGQNDLAAGATGQAAPMMENIDLDEEIELDLESYDRNCDNERYHENQEVEEEGLVIKIGDSFEEDEEEFELEEAQDDDFSGDSDAAVKLADIARKEGNIAQEKARVKIDSAKKKAAAAEKVQSVSPSVTEEIELTEEELNELEEALRVDMTNVPEGYIGTHRREAREAKAIAYAEARDDKKRERREEYAKKVADLEENLNRSHKENSELIKLVETLKEQVQKINISNAKLLYTNKVLGDVSLNERQKNHIVENISRAVSVSEAKTIYETLQSTVESIKEKTPKSLSEAINRSSSPFLVRKQPANTNNVFMERMKALAGIRNIN